MFPLFESISVVSEFYFPFFFLKMRICYVLISRKIKQCQYQTRFSLITDVYYHIS